MARAFQLVLGTGGLPVAYARLQKEPETLCLIIDQCPLCGMEHIHAVDRDPGHGMVMRPASCLPTNRARWTRQHPETAGCDGRYWILLEED